MSIEWKKWRGVVEGYEPSITAAARSLAEAGGHLKTNEEIARHVLWIAGVDHLWRHVEALRKAARGEDVVK